MSTTTPENGDKSVRQEPDHEAVAKALKATTGHYWSYWGFDRSYHATLGEGTAVRIYPRTGTDGEVTHWDWRRDLELFRGQDRSSIDVTAWGHAPTMEEAVAAALQFTFDQREAAGLRWFKGQQHYMGSDHEWFAATADGTALEISEAGRWKVASPAFRKLDDLLKPLGLTVGWPNNDMKGSAEDFSGAAIAALAAPLQARAAIIEWALMGIAGVDDRAVDVMLAATGAVGFGDPANPASAGEVLTAVWRHAHPLHSEARAEVELGALLKVMFRALLMHGLASPQATEG